ncbi:MAG: HK97 family phage prohead protease [Solirubrobacteraceae bacterium]
MIEIRDAGRGFWQASGWATTWSYGDRGAYFVGSPDGLFLERMERNAFSNATEGRDAVELRHEHREDGPVYANTSNGTLRFEDMRDGLLLAAALSKRDGPTRAAVKDIRARKLSGLSVGMHVTADRWTTAVDGRTALRSISSATLNEVSFVARPANPSAVVTDVRHETRSAGVIEYRSIPLNAALLPQPSGTEFCPDCEGSGICATCGGVGFTDDEGRSNCTDCGGSGECSNCDATGYVDEDDDETIEGRRNFSAADRKRLAAKGWALPDGSYPVETVGDLSNAIAAYGRNPTQRVRAHIIRQARRFGRTDLLPNSWAVKRAALVENDSDDLRFALECAKFGSPLRPAVALASNDDLADVRMQLADIKDRALEARQLDRLARQARGATERDRHEDQWLLRTIRAGGR